MGIYISAKCIVGLKYSELEDWFEEELDENEDYDGDVQYLIDSLFDYASPYYDSDPQDWVVGYNIYDGEPSEVIRNIQVATSEFKETIGLDAKVFFAPHVW